MSDDYTPDDEDLEPEEDDRLVKNLRGQLSEKAKEAKDAAERAERAERQLAIRDSGLDLDNPQHKFFAENFRGPVEEMAAKATELGFLEAPQPDVPDDEVASHAEIAAVTGGAQAAGGIDPEQAAYAEAAALGKAGTPYKVAEIYAKHGLAVAEG